MIALCLMIDRMTLEDVSGVALVEEECFTQPWSYQAFLDELANEQAVTFVAIKEKEIIGFLNGRILLDEGSINNIAVTQYARRHHVADELLSAFILLAEERALTSLTLEVRESNQPAIALYEKHGFKRVGLRKNFYDQPQENAVLMTRYLQG